MATRAQISRSLGGKGYWREIENPQDRYYQAQQSRRVRERDGWTYTNCGQRKRRDQMHCHQLIPRRDWWRLQYYPDEWCDTLCDECHQTADAQSGYIKWPVPKDDKMQQTLDEYTNNENDMDDKQN